VEEYGIPDAILTDMKQFEGGLNVSTLIFYWEETGLLINYSTIFSLQEGLFEIGGPRCFAPEYLSEIYIYLQDVGSQQPIDEIVDGVFPNASRLTKNLSEISAVSYEDFTTILAENDDCLPADFPVEGIDYWVGR
jgi:hypothetical protein